MQIGRIHEDRDRRVGPHERSWGDDGGSSFAVIPTRNQLDLLFVVDDVNTAAEQAKLAAQAPAFVQALQDLPGGMPDLHVAVVTSDLGAATNAPIRCSATGDAGAFQTAPAPDATCAQTPLADGATYADPGRHLERRGDGLLRRVLPAVPGRGRLPVAGRPRADGAQCARRAPSCPTTSW